MLFILGGKSMKLFLNLQMQFINKNMCLCKLLSVLLIRAILTQDQTYRELNIYLEWYHISAI